VLGARGKDTLAMVVKRIGYQSFDGMVVRVASTNEFLLALLPAQKLSQSKIETPSDTGQLAKVGFYDRALEIQYGIVIGEFFTPEELESRPNTTLAQLLQNSRFVKVRRSEGRPLLVGNADCSLSVLLDGEPLPNATGGLAGRGGAGPVNVDELTSRTKITGIEIYPNIANAPTSISSRVLGSTCGVIALWTDAR
jgi:hypothetical protein